MNTCWLAKLLGSGGVCDSLSGSLGPSHWFPGVLIGVLGEWCGARGLCRQAPRGKACPGLLHPALLLFPLSLCLLEPRTFLGLAWAPAQAAGRAEARHPSSQRRAVPGPLSNYFPNQMPPRECLGLRKGLPQVFSANPGCWESEAGDVQRPGPAAGTATEPEGPGRPLLMLLGCSYGHVMLGFSLISSPNQF